MHIKYLKSSWHREWFQKRFAIVVIPISFKDVPVCKNGKENKLQTMVIFCTVGLRGVILFIAFPYFPTQKINEQEFYHFGRRDAIFKNDC